MSNPTILPSSRSIIENKLLTALNDDSCVAILATKDDLDVLIAALNYAMLGKPEQTRRARALAADYTALRQAAFP